MGIEKRFFCDRTTEKTVHLELKDPLGNTRMQSTRKVSCQYPILDVEDLSFTHKDNVKNNTWHVKQKFPTNEFIAEMEEMEIFIPKYYEAEAWVAKDEKLTFQVNKYTKVKSSYGVHKFKPSWQKNCSSFFSIANISLYALKVGLN